MKKTVVSTILLTACVVGLAGKEAFGFGVPNSFGSVRSMIPGGGSSFSRGDIDGLYTSVKDAETLLGNSLNLVMGVLLKKDDVQKFQLRLKEIDSMKNVQEKDAELTKVQQEKLAAVQKELEKAETSKAVESLSAEQKKMYSSAVYNIALAGLRDTQAVVQANNLVRAITGNPTAAVGMAADLGKIKGIATTLPSQSTKVVSLGNNLAKVGRLGKIEIKMPQSASEAPKPVQNF